MQGATWHPGTLRQRLSPGCSFRVHRANLWVKFCIGPCCWVNLKIPLFGKLIWHHFLLQSPKMFVLDDDMTEWLLKTMGSSQFFFCVKTINAAMHQNIIWRFVWWSHFCLEQVHQWCKLVWVSITKLACHLLAFLHRRCWQLQNPKPCFNFVWNLKRIKKNVLLMQPVRFAVFLHYKNKKFSSHCSVDFSLNHACQHDVCLQFATETKRFRIEATSCFWNVLLRCSKHPSVQCLSSLNLLCLNQSSLMFFSTTVAICFSFWKNSPNLCFDLSLCWHKRTETNTTRPSPRTFWFGNL